MPTGQHARTHARTAAEECGRASVAACRAAPPPQLRPSPDPPWTTTASSAHLHPHGCRAGGRAGVLRARGRVPRANEWARLSSSGPGEASAVGTRGGVISLYLFFLSVFVSTHTGVGLVVPTKHLLANRVPNLPTAQRSAAPGQHQQFSTAQVQRLRGFSRHANFWPDVPEGRKGCQCIQQPLARLGRPRCAHVSSRWRATRRRCSHAHGGRGPAGSQSRLRSRCWRCRCSSPFSCWQRPPGAGTQRCERDATRLRQTLRAEERARGQGSAPCDRLLPRVRCARWPHALTAPPPTPPTHLRSPIRCDWSPSTLVPCCS